jgi:hypothetical protein
MSDDTLRPLLLIVGDLMRGDRHSRTTIAERTGKSLPTADRWIQALRAELPGLGVMRDGKTLWIALPVHRERLAAQLSKRWTFPSPLLRSTRSA